MELTIVIPTKDRGAIFDETLNAAMAAVTGLDAEIIVVNDSKTSKPAVPLDPVHVRLLNNSKQGVASARNLGAQEASGDVILFLDDDIIISPSTIRHILQAHREKKGIALNPDWVYPPSLLTTLDRSAFGRFLATHNMTTFRGWYADESWRPDALFPSLSVASFHLSMYRSDFIRVGGYDEQFPLAGFEDYDFPLRLKRAGVACYIDTRIVVHHNEQDRVQLRSWLNNQERRAVTRAIAVQQGHLELALTFPWSKRTVLSLLLVLYPLMLGVVKLIPSGVSMDPLEFRLIGALQAARIYRGYSMGMKK